MAATEVILNRPDADELRAMEPTADERRLSVDSCAPSTASSSASSSPEPGFQSSASSSSDELDDEEQKHVVLMLDPSEHYRPEQQHRAAKAAAVAEAAKEAEGDEAERALCVEFHGKPLAEFRRYSLEAANEDYIQQRVRDTYYQMHKHQTVEFVRERTLKWTKFNHARLTIMEALEKLNELIDESDPDSDLPNIVHAFQTAERIRAVHPNKGWLQLTGLIHDLGKVMALWGEQQWAVVGDTFVVGCAFANSIVYREHSFDENPDLRDERYSSKFGIYAPNCGLDSVEFSWGHDEYLARVLQNHSKCSLPREAIKIIRLHSFYPWHSGGDYGHLCNEDDLKTLELIREFNKFDLYTKSAPVPDIKALTGYYQTLIDQYIPGVLSW